MRPSASFLESLASVLAPGSVSTDVDDLKAFGRDWTKIYEPDASAIVFPKSTQDVSVILKRANEAQVAIVPSGGRTGLAGGAVAASGELVLSFARMNALSAVDTLGATVHVQAGAITEAVHKHVEPFGLLWPVDFASKGSSHVGGNIATNAGGVRVVRYGLTRQWVLGLTVVLASGDVLKLNGALEKNNTGVDLRQLFIGSEGSLGVITEAVLKLTKKPARQDVFLFAVPTLGHVLALFQRARSGPFQISAYEYFTDKCLARLFRHRALRPPFQTTSPYYVLLETDGEADATEWLSALFDDGVIADGVMAQHSAEAQALWALREGISESLSATGFPHKNDIALPVAHLEAFTEELATTFEAQYPDWEICTFGHIGDGNLHLNVMKPDAMRKEDFIASTHAADDVIFALVKKHQGSISAEHGIGLLKKDFLHYTRTPHEIAIMRQMKVLLDPKSILNPGKVFT
jgi:FAD/FMN-containing dehydrogenase